MKKEDIKIGHCYWVIYNRLPVKALILAKGEESDAIIAKFRWNYGVKITRSLSHVDILTLWSKENNK